MKCIRCWNCFHLACANAVELAEDRLVRWKCLDCSKLPHEIVPTLNPQSTGAVSNSGDSTSRPTKRKQRSPTSEASDAVRKSKLRQSEIRALLQDSENFDVTSGVKLLLTLHVELLETVSSIAERHSILQNWIESVDTSLNDLEHRITDLENRGDVQLPLPDVFSDLKKQNRMLIDKLDDLEDRGRRENLVFDGIVEAQDETQQTLEQKIVDLCTSRLGVADVQFDRIHRLGRRISSKPRLVICKFTFFKQKSLVFANRTSLKGTGVFIYEDFCTRTRFARKKLLEFSRELKAKGMGIFRLRYNKLVGQNGCFIYDHESAKVIELPSATRNSSCLGGARKACV